MRTHLLKISWAASLLFLAGGSYLSARLASVLLAKRLWVIEETTQRRLGTQTTAAKAENLSDYRVIVERNLFNARPTPPPPPPVVVAPPVLPPPPPLPTPPPPPPPEPVLELKVIGTAVVQGGKSFALISSGPDLRVVKEKEEIVPGALLAEVRADRILVEWRGRTEEFSLFDSKPLRGAVAGAAARGRRTPVTPERPAALEAARLPAAPSPGAGGAKEPVRQLSDDRWVVDNREVEQMRTDMGAVMSQVRVVPNFANGQPDGFKIFAIRPGSLFAKIGLQNGDIVKKINGMEINAPEQAYQAYQLLQNETRLTVDLVRGGGSKSLSYEIR